MKRTQDKSAHLHQVVDAFELFVTEQHRQMLDQIAHLRVMIEHGTRGHYATGCRHPACIEANRVYDVEYRKRHRQAVIDRIEAEYAQVEQRLIDKGQDS